MNNGTIQHFSSRPQVTGQEFDVESLVPSKGTWGINFTKWEEFLMWLRHDPVGPGLVGGCVSFSPCGLIFFGAVWNSVPGFSEWFWGGDGSGKKNDNDGNGCGNDQQITLLTILSTTAWSWQCGKIQKKINLNCLAPPPKKRSTCFASIYQTNAAAHESPFFTLPKVRYTASMVGDAI